MNCLIKQDINFDYQLPSTFVFLVSNKNVLSKLAHPLKVYQRIKFHGPTLTAVKFCIHLRSSKVVPLWKS
jgi:hypothetical protein